MPSTPATPAMVHPSAPVSAATATAAATNRRSGSRRAALLAIITPATAPPTRPPRVRPTDADDKERAGQRAGQRQRPPAGDRRGRRREDEWRDTERCPQPPQLVRTPGAHLQRDRALIRCHVASSRRAGNARAPAPGACETSRPALPAARRPSP